MHLILLRHTTLDRTALDERSAHRRELYLTTYNTDNRHTTMPPVGFEPAIPASERPQTAQPTGSSLLIIYCEYVAEESMEIERPCTEQTVVKTVILLGKYY